MNGVVQVFTTDFTDNTDFVRLSIREIREIRGKYCFAWLAASHRRNKNGQRNKAKHPRKGTMVLKALLKPDYVRYEGVRRSTSTC